MNTETGIAKRTVDTPSARVAYRESGQHGRPAVLFVHGIPTSGFLWRHVMTALGDGFHCLAPDLPGLGETIVDPSRTDFSMPGLAETLVDFLEALGIERAHVVAHDQGGAAAQILAVRHERRVDRLVLTDCVCYDNWPVPAVRRLQWLARLPRLPDLAARLGLVELLQAHLPGSAFRRGFVDPSRLSPEVVAEYLRPLRGEPAAREAFRAFLLAGSARHTMAVAAGLRALACPTLVLWAEQDRYLPVAWGEKLARDIPRARLEVVPGAGHFWPEEAPGPFASRILAFLEAPDDRAIGPSPKHFVPVVSAGLPRKCPASPPRRGKEVSS
jgi:pimeloyl-ACP methyl ester carboxylesterase